jgi:hypothetical protein
MDLEKFFEISEPISFMTVTAQGFSFPGLDPALRTSA